MSRVCVCVCVCVRARARAIMHSTCEYGWHYDKDPTELEHVCVFLLKETVQAVFPMRAVHSERS